MMRHFYFALFVVSGLTSSLALGATEDELVRDLRSESPGHRIAASEAAHELPSYSPRLIKALIDAARRPGKAGTMTGRAQVAAARALIDLVPNDLSAARFFLELTEKRTPAELEGVTEELGRLPQVYFRNADKSVEAYLIAQAMDSEIDPALSAAAVLTSWRELDRETAQGILDALFSRLPRLRSYSQLETEDPWGRFLNILPELAEQGATSVDTAILLRRLLRDPRTVTAGAVPFVRESLMAMDPHSPETISALQVALTNIRRKKRVMGHRSVVLMRAFREEEGHLMLAIAKARGIDRTPHASPELSRQALERQIELLAAARRGDPEAQGMASEILGQPAGAYARAFEELEPEDRPRLIRQWFKALGQSGVRGSRRAAMRLALRLWRAQTPGVREALRAEQGCFGLLETLAEKGYIDLES